MSQPSQQSQTHAAEASVDELSTGSAERLLQTTDTVMQKSTTVKNSAYLLDSAAISSSIEDENNTDDDVVLRVRPGRRNGGRPFVDSQSEDSDGDKDEEDNQNGKAAYARVKAMLSRKPEDSVAAKTSTTSSASTSPEPSKDRKRLLHRRRIARFPSVGSTSSRNSSSASSATSPRSTLPAFSRGTPRPSTQSDSDDLPEDPLHNAEFKKRVERIRAERLQAEEKARAEKNGMVEDPKGSEADEDDDSDQGARFTQSTRPTRGASKRALEEMTRETQRVLRNEQWGHKATTRKRFTTKDLFARLQFRPDAEMEREAATKGTSSADQKEMAESGISDAEEATGRLVELHASASSDAGDLEHQDVETPPTSPPSYDDTLQKSQLVSKQLQEHSTLANTADNEVEPLPNLSTVLAQPVVRLDKGKGRALDQDTAPDPLYTNPRDYMPKLATRAALSKIKDTDSDDDLEILPAKAKSRFAVFDRVPAKKEKQSSLLIQKALANTHSPVKASSKSRTGRKTMNPKQMHAQLLLRMREQARQDSDEKRRAKFGDDEAAYSAVQRQDDANWIRDTLEKERKADAKRAKKEAKEFSDDGLSDDEYVEAGEDGADMSQTQDVDGAEAVNQTGSDDEALVEDSYDEDEEETDEDEEMEDGDETGPGNNPYFSDEAEDDAENEESNLVAVDPSISKRNPPSTPLGSPDAELPRQSAAFRPFSGAPRVRRRLVVDDDEEDEDDLDIEASQNFDAAAFGFEQQTNPLISATQLFAGTMATQTQGDDFTGQMAIQMLGNENELQTWQSLSAAVADDGHHPETQVADSQRQNVTERNTTVQQSAEPQASSGGDSSISADHLQESVLASPGNFSQTPDLTQDGGFTATQAFSHTPVSTTDTVLMPVMESPITEKKRGKLRRRGVVLEAESDLESDGAPPPANVGRVKASALDAVNNAFDTMRKNAQKKQHPAFDKKKSEAKNIVDEQAEESEDEWAGLGGASDDESTGEVDEEVQRMLNDANDEEVDERAMAAIHAEREVIESKQQAEQIYRDIKTGKWRQNRHGGFDLSDDEDDERQRRRRMFREDQKRSKALKAQGTGYEKLAENPKKHAFWQTLEDRDGMLDADFLDGPQDEPSNPISDSQPASGHPTDATAGDGGMAGAAQTTIPSTDPNPRKRKADDSIMAMDHRRSNPAKRPANLLDIQESLSFLIDEPESIPESQFSEDEDEEDFEQIEKQRLLASERAPVVNRLARKPLGDASASNVNAARQRGDIDAPMAFYTSENAMPTFKVPALLRRATTNMSNISNASSTSNSGTSTPTGSETGGVKRGGSKKSNIHYQAREAERRKLVEEADRRRKEGVRKKIAGRRKGGSILGSLAGLGMGEGFD